MGKMFAVSLALLLLLPVASAGEEVAGKIQRVDPAQRVVVLDDGTMLWVEESYQIRDLAAGEKIKAAYEVRDGKNIVTELEHRVMFEGTDDDPLRRETTNFGSTERLQE